MDQDGNRDEFGPSGVAAGRRLRLLAVLLASLAVVWLGYQSWRALFQPAPLGPIDLRNRHRETIEWFDGRAIYDERPDAVYPPASYALLAPLLVHCDRATARIAWFGLEVLCLALVVRFMVRACGARAPDQRRVCALLALGTYPVGASIGIGQLGVPVLAALLGAILVMERTDSGAPRSLARVALAAASILVALVKPTLAAPFVLLLLVRTGWRGVGLCVAGYVALTLLATSAQDAGTVELLRAWLERAENGARYGASHGEGAIRATAEDGWRISHVNLHSALGALELEHYAMVATIAAFVLTGAWVVIFRRAPIWVLAGGVAIVARSATYHAWYDDVVLLPMLVALWRLASDVDVTSPRLRSFARGLFIADLALLLAPGAVYALPRLAANTVVVVHAIVLATTMCLLVAVSWRTPHGASRTTPA